MEKIYEMSQKGLAFTNRAGQEEDWNERKQY
jgi:hypothetical protein